MRIARTAKKLIVDHPTEAQHSQPEPFDLKRGETVQQDQSVKEEPVERHILPHAQLIDINCKISFNRCSVEKVSQIVE